VNFPAQSPDLRRLPLAVGASRFRARSPRLAAPLIRFLFVNSRLRYRFFQRRPRGRTGVRQLVTLRFARGRVGLLPQRTFTSNSLPCWAHIGIGAGGFTPSVPCHTTGHAGPHPAVRSVEVMRRASVSSVGRSSVSARRSSGAWRSFATSGVSWRRLAGRRPRWLRGVSFPGRSCFLFSTV